MRVPEVDMRSVNVWISGLKVRNFENIGRDKLHAGRAFLPHRERIRLRQHVVLAQLEQILCEQSMKMGTPPSSVLGVAALASIFALRSTPESIPVRAGAGIGPAETYTPRIERMPRGLPPRRYLLHVMGRRLPASSGTT